LNKSVSSNRPKLSMVVVSFNMERELPKTLNSLSTPYQIELEEGDIEIIVVDNGSIKLPDEKKFPGCARLISVTNPNQSPSRAINIGLAEASADLVGVLIDGARMASPGLCNRAWLASQLDDRAVISSLGFHLGPDVQMKSVEHGYCQKAEDKLLASINWPENGYQLFSISSFAGSSSGGWFRPMSESNAIFMSRDMWSGLGGYDEEFITPGGGLVNLDAYVRACELPKMKLITLLGEATFHQVHGGIATNQKRPDASWEVFHNEYVEIRGKTFKAPQCTPLFFGSLPNEVISSFEHSASRLLASLVKKKLAQVKLQLVQKVKTVVSFAKISK
jgi:hypothetical protein